MAEILLVEDDKMTQILMKSILISEGHKVFVSPTGEHALETLVSGNCFDILITDVMMPGMDGRELIKQVRCDDTINEMPIIIVSGAIKSSEVWSLLESGATYFIPKPVKSDVLHDCISMCIKDCENIKDKNQKA